MKNGLALFYRRCLLTFLLLGNMGMYSQEWQAWSEWQKSYLEEKLSHRLRIKNISSDTYVVQVEWRNRSEVEKEIRFEVRDSCDIAEVNRITIPGEASKTIYAGKKFQSSRIKLYLLWPEPPGK